MSDPKPHTTQVFLPYYITTLAVSCVTQIAIALGSPSAVTLSIGVSIIAILYFLFLSTKKNQLGRIRFGFFVAHATTFAIVNVPIWVSLFIAAIAGTNITESANASFQLTAASCMGCFWGLGLLIHSFGTIMGRGFEHSA